MLGISWNLLECWPSHWNSLELPRRPWNVPFSALKGRRLAVRFLGVEDAFDLEGAVLLAEEDAMVLGAEPDYGRWKSLEFPRTTWNAGRGLELLITSWKNLERPVSRPQAAQVYLQASLRLRSRKITR